MGAVGGRGDEFVEESADGGDDLFVGALVASADVVGFADATGGEDCADGGAVVADVEPVADLEAVTVNGERLAFQRMKDHERDEFFGELEGAVVVGAVGDERGEAEGVVPGADEVVAGGFRGGVGAVGGEGRVFVEGGVGGGEGAVDLVGGDVEEAEGGAAGVVEGGVEGAGGLQELEGAADVGVEEGAGFEDGAVDVAFGGEMEDGTGAMVGEDAGEEQRGRRCLRGQRCSAGRRRQRRACRGWPRR